MSVALVTGAAKRLGRAMALALAEQGRDVAVHYSSSEAEAESLCAELRDIRACGIAWDNEEHEPGIRCIAAPILSPQGRVLGALSITSGQRAEHDRLERHVPLILDTADKIAKAASDWRFPEQKRPG